MIKRTQENKEREEHVFINVPVSSISAELINLLESWEGVSELEFMQGLVAEAADKRSQELREKDAPEGSAQTIVTIPISNKTSRMLEFIRMKEDASERDVLGSLISKGIEERLKNLTREEGLKKRLRVRTHNS